MPSVFVTRPIPGPGIDLLKESGFDVTVHPKDEIISKQDLLDGVKGKDALLSLLTDPITEDVMEAAGKQLKIIANYAVGFDNIDLAAAKKRNIIVTNTPVPEMTEAVAEFTITSMLSLARNIAAADAFTRAEKYAGWSPTLLLGSSIRGKTLGIIGAGRIGTRVAEIARFGLGMKIVYTSGHPVSEFSERLHAAYLPLEQLLQTADVVSLHVPLLPTTKHLISTEQFALMKKTALLINTSRGPVVDEKALLRALKTERIAGAALDVYEAEPSIDADPTDRLELKSFANTLLTPHIGSATIETRIAMSRLAASNIVEVLEGRTALTPAAVS